MQGHDTEPLTADGAPWSLGVGFCGGTRLRARACVRHPRTACAIRHVSGTRRRVRSAQHAASGSVNHAQQTVTALAALPRPGRDTDITGIIVITYVAMHTARAHLRRRPAARGLASPSPPATAPQSSIYCPNPAAQMAYSSATARSVLTPAPVPRDGWSP